MRDRGTPHSGRHPFLSVTCVLLTRANFSGTAEATRKMQAFDQSVRLSYFLQRGIGNGILLCPYHWTASPDV